ncbi:MAG TPA: hypothetical protein PK867_10640 [Pirellulales bacterium]|nr:hypothetical protein [Pirellulales bacterium]
MPVAQVGCVEGHIHILCHLSRTMSVAELVEEIKIPTPTGRRRNVAPTALSYDDRSLAIGNHDSTIDVVELATGRQRRLGAHDRVVLSLDFSLDGRTLAGGTDGTVRLWRVDVGEPLGILERRTNGEIQQIAFLADGSTLAAARRGLQRARSVIRGCGRFLPRPDAPRPIGLG